LRATAADFGTDPRRSRFGFSKAVAKFPNKDDIWVTLIGGSIAHRRPRGPQWHVISVA
jgi:hypothetical protein